MCSGSEVISGYLESIERLHLIRFCLRLDVLGS